MVLAKLDADTAKNGPNLAKCCQSLDFPWSRPDLSGKPGWCLLRRGQVLRGLGALHVDPLAVEQVRRLQSGLERGAVFYKY